MNEPISLSPEERRVIEKVGQTIVEIEKQFVHWPNNLWIHIEEDTRSLHIMRKTDRNRRAYTPKGVDMSRSLAQFRIPDPTKEE